MDLRESYLGKRGFSERKAPTQQRLDEDEIPVKKKLRTKLVDLFNRASISMAPHEDYIKVYLRIKPFTQDEISSQRCFVLASEENTLVATAPEISHAYKNLKRGLGNSSHKFTFSRIFNENTSQGDFFNSTMLGMTKDFISGQNSLVFTYGVTSSGKTYTIQGQAQNAGILPRCLDVVFNSINGKQISSTTCLKPHMFTDVVKLSPAEVAQEKKIKDRTLKMSSDEDTTVMALLGDEMESALSDTATASSSDCGDELLQNLESRYREKLKVDVEDQGKIRFGVWVSFAEIYNEQTFDLLEPIPRKKTTKRPTLKICEDKSGNPYIKGLKEIHVESADEAYRLLTIGQRNLQTACTRLNHCSSRSHCIFNIKIIRVVDKDDPNIARVSMLSLCDLAGSERYSKTQATGDRLKEAGNINASIMTLGRCIETLRHNQQHRDQPRLVPFRDSKLTRLLQNYFNGSGRAAMIVNVSQCVSMFDDTLHVFKFSAIAKQVKYIEKPPEPPKKPVEKRAIPPAQRPSIEWEVQAPLGENAVLKDARNHPLPSGDDDDEDDLQEDGEDSNDDSSSDSLSDVNEMRNYIKTLEYRIERLVEMLQEEIEAAKSLESSVRQEVSQAMMNQVVNIEETYSALLRETSEDEQELADERIRGLMEVYEQRLERIQRKVDEDDEWVSSLLYHQLQIQVEEKDATIVSQTTQIQDLNSQLAELKTKVANDSVDMGNSVLIETLTHKLQESNDKCKVQSEKIEELESLVTEAGEVYNKHIEEISKLTKKNEKIEIQLSAMKELENQLKEMTSKCEALKLSLSSKETEWKAKEEKLNMRIQRNDDIISSLQDDCKELHDEIERLQDKMSQMDENSKYCNDLDTSALGEDACATDGDTTRHDRSLVQEKYAETSFKVETDNEIQRSLKKSSSMRHIPQDDVSSDTVSELMRLKEESAKKDTEFETVKLANVELEKQTKCLQTKIDDLVTEIKIANEKCGKSLVDAEMLQTTVDQLREERISSRQCAVTAEEKLTTAEEKLASSHQVNNQIDNEMEVLQSAHAEVTKRVHVLEKQLEDLSEKQNNPEQENKITAASGKPNKIASQVTRSDAAVLMDQSDDDEIVFSSKVTDFLKQMNDKLKEEKDALQVAYKALTEKCQALEDQLNSKDMKQNTEEDGEDVNIGDMVRQLEQKTTPFHKSSMSDKNTMDQSDDTEVILKSVSKFTERSLEMKTPSTATRKTSGSTAIKLRDAELANAALRSKLKREEEDYFKREQALIHGYTAEIDNLKYELAKMKSKVDGPSKTLTRGKRKATTAIDTSMSSVVSDSISEVSVVGDSKLLNIQEESMVNEKQSVAILSDELVSVQQELFSVYAAYRKLMSAQKRNVRNSCIQDMTIGQGSQAQSALMVFRNHENFGDSVLQFELDEYGVKMEEMRIKISQQAQEIKVSKTAFNKVMVEKSEIESKLKDILLNQEEITVPKEKQESLNMNEEKLSETAAANCQLQSEVKELQEVTAQLKETLKSAITAKNEAVQSLSDVTEQLNSSKEQLLKAELSLAKLQEEVVSGNDERDSLKLEITNLKEVHNHQGRHTENFEHELQRLTDLLKQTECHLKASQESLVNQENVLQVSNDKLADITAEKVRLEESVKRKCEELDLCKEKAAELEQKYNDVKESLDKTVSIKDNIENQLKHTSEELTLKGEAISKLKEEHDSRIDAMKQELSVEGKAQLEAITNLERCIVELKTQLQQKATELEKLECQKQEEAAEVSQKLLMLERERKVAERRAAEAKEKEMEWQQKCQALNSLSQLEQQMRQDLRTAAESLRKHSMLTSELRDELAIKNKEMDQFRVELATVKTSGTRDEDLEGNIKALELSVASKQKQLQEVQKGEQDRHEQIDLLKNSLKECGETIKEQDYIISTLDDELKSLKTRLESQEAEVEALNSTVSQKQQTADNLNQKISKLEAEVKGFRQAEQDAMSVEQICHEQLQKSRCENREMEDRIKQLEQENKVVEENLSRSEKQVKKEKKALEALEERLEKTDKQKKELEREIEELTEKQRMLEEQVKKGNQEKEKEIKELTEKQKMLEEQVKKGNQERERELEREIEELTEKQRMLEEQVKKGNQEKEKEIRELTEKQKMLEEWAKKGNQERESELEREIEELTEKQRMLEEQVKKGNQEKEKEIKELTEKQKMLDEQVKKGNQEKEKEIEELTGKQRMLEGQVKKGNQEREREIKELTGKQRMLDEQVKTSNREREEAMEQLRLVEAELKNLRKESEEGSIEKSRHQDLLQKENNNLNEELIKLKQDISSKQEEMDKVLQTLKQTTENLKTQEKELKKQSSRNKRNREEMENWKQERDNCVNKLEQHISKGHQDYRQLVQENEQLKRDNAELAKNSGNITAMKDSVIADLRKNNNTLSIQLARVQGMSPPPKIATPDSSVFHRSELIDDLDTTGHLEVDATPPIAAKKVRKRQGSSRQSHDAEVWSTPSAQKSLKPIEEQSENSPRTPSASPTKSSLHGRVAEIASDVLASISPLTRSARRQEKETKRKHLTLLAPFDLASYVAASETQNENSNPNSTRRSSRLKTKSKH